MSSKPSYVHESRFDHFSSHKSFTTLIEFITMNDTGVNIRLFCPLENHVKGSSKNPVFEQCHIKNVYLKKRSGHAATLQTLKMKPEMRWQIYTEELVHYKMLRSINYSKHNKFAYFN